MLSKREVATPPLPKNWKRGVRSAVLNVISLAQLSIAYARGWAANSINARVRLKAENDRLREEIALLREEMRIKDSRMTLIVPQRRPHYAPTERMAILELRAARGWSLSQSADSFLVTSATIASWVKRIDEEGPESLVQICQPVNKFPDFVRYVVQRLKALCPRLGKVKIAQILSRAGLHLGVTTIGRMLKESPRFQPTEIAESSSRIVTAKRPNHVWHVDRASPRRRVFGPHGFLSRVLSNGLSAGGSRWPSTTIRDASWASRFLQSYLSRPPFERSSDVPLAG